MTAKTVKPKPGLAHFEARHVPFLRALKNPTTNQSRIIELANGPRCRSEDLEYWQLMQGEKLLHRAGQVYIRVHTLQAGLQKEMAKNEVKEAEKTRTHDLVQWGLAIKALEIAPWITPEIFLGYFKTLHQKSPEAWLWLKNKPELAEQFGEFGRSIKSPQKPR
jgi:hypothetical protein